MSTTDDVSGVDLASAPRLAIFARAPRRGRVKTRLARDVGEGAAFTAYRQLLAGTLAELAPGRGRFAPEIWVEGDAPEVAEWRRRFPVLRQPDGDLGARMAAAFDHGVNVLVGCDIPALTADHVDAALDLLAEADVVLAPTEDGGYCLIALNAPQPALFEAIPWGTHQVLAATLAAAGALSVRLLAPLWDVDNGADLARWERERPALLRAGRPSSHACPRAVTLDSSERV